MRLVRQASVLVVFAQSQLLLGEWEHKSSGVMSGTISTTMSTRPVPMNFGALTEGEGDEMRQH